MKTLLDTRKISWRILDYRPSCNTWTKLLSSFNCEIRISLWLMGCIMRTISAQRLTWVDCPWLCSVTRLTPIRLKRSSAPKSTRASLLLTRITPTAGRTPTRCFGRIRAAGGPCIRAWRPGSPRWLDRVYRARMTARTGSLSFSSSWSVVSHQKPDGRKYPNCANGLNKRSCA